MEGLQYTQEQLNEVVANAHRKGYQVAIHAQGDYGITVAVNSIEYAMKKLSDAIGPILTIGLAAVVGFFALAIFLPMWDLTLMAR